MVQLNKMHNDVKWLYCTIYFEWDKAKIGKISCREAKIFIYGGQTEHSVIEQENSNKVVLSEI